MAQKAIATSRTQNRGLVWAVASGLLLASQGTGAHHSLSNYKEDRTFSLKGTATEFVFINPHALVRFRVRDANGNVENWSAETAAARRLGEAGWDKDTIRPGDQITVIGRVAKNGSRRMFIERVLINGKEFVRGRR